MKISVGILVVSLCVLACLGPFAAAGKVPEGDIKLQDIQLILAEAGISPERQDKFFETERQAGMAKFVKTMNAALVALLATANLEE